ncbi:MAG: nucleotidyltransferase family protein [Patescibacteria group bacterium]
MTSQDILNLIRKDEWMMNVLLTVRDLHLPDWMIGAGFVRGKVWDFLHGYVTRTPLGDIDVIYYDKTDLREEKEVELQNILKGKMPDSVWSVTNQARMHIENNDAEYKSSEDALAHWPETPTCVAVLIDENHNLKLVTPYGIKDLVSLEIRPSPKFTRDIKLYRERINKKKWQEKWPQLKIHNLG